MAAARHSLLGARGLHFQAACLPLWVIQPGLKLLARLSLRAWVARRSVQVQVAVVLTLPARAEEWTAPVQMCEQLAPVRRAAV